MFVKSLGSFLESRAIVVYGDLMGGQGRSLSERGMKV